MGRKPPNDIVDSATIHTQRFWTWEFIAVSNKQSTKKSKQYGVIKRKMEQVAMLEQNTSSRPSQGPTRSTSCSCMPSILFTKKFSKWLHFPYLPCLVFRSLSNPSYLVSSPRVYPKAFAERIRALFSDLVKNGRGKPELPTHEIDGAVAFENLSWSDWPEARLMGPLRYARGNKHLSCPPNWKSSFPKAIEILNTWKGEHWTVNPWKAFMLGLLYILAI